MYALAGYQFLLDHVNGPFFGHCASQIVQLPSARTLLVTSHITHLLGHNAPG